MSLLTFFINHPVHLAVGLIFSIAVTKLTFIIMDVVSWQRWKKLNQQFDPHWLETEDLNIIKNHK